MILPMPVLPPDPPTIRFVGGRIFDGRGFRRRDLLVAGGTFVARLSGAADRTVDLAGAYVVPPFGEAHNHNIESPYTLDKIAARYLREGTFYVKNPNSIPRITRGLAGKINGPGKLDASFSNGGLTGPGGHPVTLYAGLAKTVYRFDKIADMEGEAHHQIKDAAELAEKWPRIVAGRPEFLKTYLFHSEEYALRRDDPKFVGERGLDPALLPLIVARARRLGLRVSTHVNSAADFRVAAEAGVDEINHLPGRFAPAKGDFARYRISDSDARLVARKRIVVVPTYSLLVGEKNDDPALVEETKTLQRENLRTLRRAGVAIAIGTDSYGSTALTEARYLAALGVFGNLELLKMWCETTPRTIFPDRRIGRIAPGYEASFVALAEDPTRRFGAVEDIVLRYKQGEPVPPSP